MAIFDEKSFPFTNDQIQELIYDFLYESGIDPTKHKIPDFQKFLNSYNLDLKYIGS